MVIAVCAAANRDPSVFDKPDEIDPYRRSLTPLSFGAGRHFCIGVHLAKLEAQIAWRHLARRLPFGDVAVTEIEYERRAFIRTPRRMIVRQAKRSEESRVGKEGVSTCKSRGSPSH